MSGYKHRIISCWINDISSRPRMGKRWPMIDLDDDLVRDYYAFIDMAADSGFNGLVIWGLFVNHQWPLKLEQCMPSERQHRVHRILSHADRRGLTIYTGLGVYSWGFEEIIKAHPNLMQGEEVKAWQRIVPHNHDVMCFNQPASREWMRRVIDFIVDQTDVSGFQLQPFDKGRCICSECSKMSDDEYFSALNEDVAGYIKSRWPEKKVAVSGWGMYFSPITNMGSVKKMCRSLDYISDITDSCLKLGEGFRQQMIAQIPCAFGDAAGGSVTPPQTWDRLRWYLPHIRFNGQPAQSLFADGGQACEVFAGPLENPGTEVSLRALGAILENPLMSCEDAAEQAVERVYAPKTVIAKQTLANLILQAEAAYFDHLAPSKRFTPMFEPLDSVFPNRPTYLIGRSEESLNQYASTLKLIKINMERLYPETRMKGRLNDTLTAIDNTVSEVEQILAGVWKF